MNTIPLVAVLITLCLLFFCPSCKTVAPTVATPSNDSIVIRNVYHHDSIFLHDSMAIAIVRDTVFVHKWLSVHKLTPEAQSLLSKGKEIYRFYFENLNQLRTNKFKIETWDAGWYQIRMALKNADLAANKILELKELHRALRAKLLPQLTEYGII